MYEKTEEEQELFYIIYDNLGINKINKCSFIVFEGSLPQSSVTNDQNIIIILKLIIK